MPVLEIKKVEKGATLGLWKIDESLAELVSMLPVLATSKKYERFHHDTRRIEWLVARALMREMEMSWDLEYSEHGKPFYIKGPKISISHSKDYVAIISHPESEVGIDVQEIVSKVERIKNKYCNASELTWAKNIEDYTFIWSAKEALFKVKERNVHFSEDIKVFPPEGAFVKIEFRDQRIYRGELLSIEGYKGVYVIE